MHLSMLYIIQLSFAHLNFCRIYYLRQYWKDAVFGLFYNVHLQCIMSCFIIQVKYLHISLCLIWTIHKVSYHFVFLWYLSTMHRGMSYVSTSVHQTTVLAHDGYEQLLSCIVIIISYVRRLAYHWLIVVRAFWFCTSQLRITHCIFRFFCMLIWPLDIVIFFEWSDECQHFFTLYHHLDWSGLLFNVSGRIYSSTEEMGPLYRNRRTSIFQLADYVTNE